MSLVTRGDSVKKITFEMLKKNPSKYFDMVKEDELCVSIDGKKIIMLSQEQFEELERTKHNLEYLNKIDDAISEAERIFPNFKSLGFDK